MSVVILTKFQVDASVLEELAAGKYNDTLMRLAETGRSIGAIHHRFVQDPDGSLLAIDEWESEEAYRQFFGGQAEIKTLLEEAGVKAPPTTTVYRIADIPDGF